MFIFRPTLSTIGARLVLSLLVLTLPAARADEVRPVAAATLQEASPEQQPDPIALLESIRPAWSKVKDLTYVLEKKERLTGGEVHAERLFFKVQVSPYRSYNKLLPPGPPQETLYREGVNNGKMLAHPGKFPDITVSLDPRGGLAMRNQHHTVLNGGFGTFIGLIEAALAKGKEMRAEGADVRLLGEETWEGRPTWKIELRSPEVPHRRYRVRKGEDLWSIAETFNLGMYLLAYVNGLDDPADVSPGDEIDVPEFYARRVVVQLDKQTRMPVVQEIYGHDGKLFEYYAFHELKLNPGLTDRDFDPDNEEYDF